MTKTILLIIEASSDEPYLRGPSTFEATLEAAARHREDNPEDKLFYLIVDEKGNVEVSSFSEDDFINVQVETDISWDWDEEELPEES